MLNSAGWQSLGEVNYRKWVLYEYEESLPYFEDSTCILCENAGPFVIWWKLEQSHEKLEGSYRAGIFSLTGERLALISYTEQSIASGGICWVKSRNPFGEDLVALVLANGQVKVLNMIGVCMCEFTLVQVSKDVIISQVCKFQDGFVAFLSNGKLLQIYDILLNQDSLKSFADNEKYKCRYLNRGSSVIPIEEINEKEVTFSAINTSSDNVIIALRSGGILLINENTVSTFQLEGVDTEIVRITVAPNNRFIACFTAAGQLFVYNMDFDKKVLSFDAKTSVPPHQIQWCGEDSVVMYWKGLGLLMVGPYGDWVKYTYSEPLSILQEADSLRIVSKEKSEILQRVTTATDSIARIGSFAPPAMLVDAFDAIRSNDAKGYDNVKALVDEGTLAQAVRECIEAATYEFETTSQDFLLQVAVFGKKFLPVKELSLTSSRVLREACNSLRILNILRHETIGIPLTISQFKRLKISGIVQRLIVRNHHFLAYRVCSKAHTTSRVKRHIVEDWGCKKVLALASLAFTKGYEQEQVSSTSLNLRKIPQYSDAPDETLDSNDGIETTEVYRLVKAKFMIVRGCSFAKVGLLAYREGHYELGEKLIKNDYIPARRALSFLEISKWQSALAAALVSRDFNLIFFSLVHTWKRIEAENTIPQFYSMLMIFPELAELFRYYCSEASHQLSLKESLENLGGLHDTAELFMKESYSTDDVSRKIHFLQKAHELVQKHRSYSRLDGVIKGEMNLIKAQRELEELSGQDCFIGLGLVDTIHNCIILGLTSEAESLKSKFRLSNRQFYHAKIKALGEKADWLELRRFATSRNSPIGYEPFARICISKGELHEALFYVSQVREDETKLYLLLELKSWEEASHLAIKLRDAVAALQIKAQCQDQNLLEMLSKTLD